MPAQEPNQPAPAKKQLRTDQRAPNQKRSQPTTTPQNLRYRSTSGLEAIWKSVHGKLDDLRQRVRDLGAEVQRSQGLVRAVKRQMEDVNNAQIIERVDRDAWTGTTEIGGRLGLLQLEIDWIIHDLVQGRPTPSNPLFSPRGHYGSRSASPVMSTSSGDSVYFSEDDYSLVLPPMRARLQQRRRREVPPLPRRSNVIFKSLHRRGERQYDTDETSDRSITSSSAKLHTIPSYSRKSRGVASVISPRRQKIRASLERPHEVKLHEERYPGKSQEHEQQQRLISKNISATNIDDRPPEPSVAVVQELQERHSQQGTQGVSDQETGDDPVNEEETHEEREVKRKLEEEEAVLQKHLCAVQEKIRLKEQRKQV